ncbi:MFS transporter [Pseudonocardia yuanmonensis]|uniref:MFS transporter n=1 Tax=Pseudonocardia yuanmonensis TaxID=1095914 RepID=A0ABP8VVD5_9PSEU
MAVTAGKARTGTRGRFEPYRAVLRIPGLPPLLGLSLLSRIPASGAAIVLTLHVVLTLGQGYAAAGSVGAASTIGMAVGAPLLGRLIDRVGLRPVLVLGMVTETAFWSVAPVLPYPALVVGALLAGTLGVPLFSVVRQSIGALVPEAQRRPAFAVDSMAVELSYIIGPALGTVLVLQTSSPLAVWTVGGGRVLAGAALWLLNPLTRAPRTDDEGAAPPIRQWLDRRLLAALLATAAAVIVVFGTELTMIAGLQSSGQAAWIPVVNTVWCLASLTGGLVYGAMTRAPSLPVITAAVGVAALPVALGGVWWSYALLLLPCGLLLAPSLAASSEAVSRLAPEPARGVVTGLHASAITLGAAAGTPLAGLLIDLASPAMAVLTVGGLGIAVAATAGVFGGGLSARRGRRASPRL